MNRLVVLLVFLFSVWFPGCEKTPIDSMSNVLGKLDKIGDNSTTVLGASYNYYGELYPDLAPASFHQEASKEFEFIKYDASVGKWYCDNGDASVNDESLLACDDWYGSNEYGSAFDIFSRPNETPATLGYGSGYTITLDGFGKSVLLQPPTYSDLNPSYESWTTSEQANRPVAWQVTGLTGYDEPASWTSVNYFPSLNQDQQDPLDGNYSTGIPINSTMRNKVFASGYFEIPVNSRSAGVHSMTFHVKGNVGAGNALYIAGAFFQADDDLESEVRVYIPQGNYVEWQPVTLSYDPIEPIRYVRFAVITANRVSITGTVNVDLVQLRNDIGDVTLPVTLMYFRGYGSPYYLKNQSYNFYDDVLKTEFQTGSEINNQRFELYWWYNNNWTLASNTYIPGQGTDPFGEYYQANFTLNSTVAYAVYISNPGTLFKFCLGNRDYDGQLYLYDDPDLVINYYKVP